MASVTRKCAKCRALNHRPTSKFCSRRCADQARRSWSRSYARCLVCGEHFHRERVTRVYCSDACRKRAARNPELTKPAASRARDSKAARSALRRLERLAAFLDEPYAGDALRAIRDRDRLGQLLRSIRARVEPFLKSLEPNPEPEPQPERPAPGSKVKIPPQPVDGLIRPPPGGFLR